MTHQRLYDRETVDDVLEQSIIKHLHKAVSKLCEIARDWEYSVEDRFLILSNLLGVFAVVTSIFVRFLDSKFSIH